MFCLHMKEPCVKMNPFHPDHEFFYGLHVKQASSICRAWKCLRRIIQNYFRTSLKTLHPLSAVSLGVGLSVVPPVHAVHPEKLNLVSLSAFVHWFRESFPIVSGSKQIVSPLELIRSLWIMKRPQKSSFDNPFLILIGNLPRACDESSEMGPQLCFLQLVLMSVIEPFRFGFQVFSVFVGFTFYWP